MTTATADYDKAIKKATEVLRDNYVLSPPVNPYELAKNYGLEVLEVDFGNEKFKDVAGYIDLETEKIFVNKNDSKNRKKFTVAHELGHYFLHRERMKEDPNIAVLYRIPLGTLNKDPIEKEANCFAANLLVPEGLLKEKMDQNEDVNFLADVFKVSRDLIGFRIENVTR